MVSETNDAVILKKPVEPKYTISIGYSADKKYRSYTGLFYTRLILAIFRSVNLLAVGNILH